MLIGAKWHAYRDCDAFAARIRLAFKAHFFVVWALIGHRLGLPLAFLGEQRPHRVGAGHHAARMTRHSQRILSAALGPPPDVAPAWLRGSSSLASATIRSSFAASSACSRRR